MGSGVYRRVSTKDGGKEPWNGLILKDNISIKN